MGTMSLCGLGIVLWAVCFTAAAVCKNHFVVKKFLSVIKFICSPVFNALFYGTFVVVGWFSVWESTDHRERKNAQL